MLDAPKQNWSLYESMSRQADAVWIRGLSAGDRFTIYADLFNMIWRARQPAQFSEKLEERRWRQKLELRQRSASAFAKLDQWRRERTSTDHAG